MTQSAAGGITGCSKWCRPRWCCLGSKRPKGSDRQRATDHSVRRRERQHTGARSKQPARRAQMARTVPPTVTLGRRVWSRRATTPPQRERHARPLLVEKIGGGRRCSGKQRGGNAQAPMDRRLVRRATTLPCRPSCFEFRINERWYRGQGGDGGSGHRHNGARELRHDLQWSICRNVAVQFGTEHRSRKEYGLG